MTNDKRFLIVQLADIGDMVLSTPAMSALREAYPTAHITLLAASHAAPVVEGRGLVDEIITFDRRQFNSSKALFRPSNLRLILGLGKGRYDAVVFFHHFTLKLGTLKFGLIAFASRARRRIGLRNGNGWFLNECIADEGFGVKHQAQYWLDLVGLLGADTSPRVAQVCVDDADAIYHVPTTRNVVIHAGSGGYSLARRWEAERFAAVADVLHDEYGAQIVLVGAESDNSQEVTKAMRAVPLDLTGKTSLAQLAAVIEQADLFIGADSGVIHIAAATGTPLVTIFGPSNQQAWSPWTPGGRSIVVRSGPECSPCSYVEHGIGLRDGCLARTCMKMVTIEMVLDAARGMLDTDAISDTIYGVPTDTPSQIDRAWERIRVLGLPVDAISYVQWLDAIGQWVEADDGCHHVCTTNPEFTMIAQKDVNFRNILKRSDICVPDGVGLLWAARRLGTPLPERVTGSDGVPKIAERAAKDGWKLFFLGAGPGIADSAADVLRERYPDLQIVGIYGGSPAPDEEDAIVEMVNQSGADILLVAYGAPKQDAWIARNKPRLRVSMAMGIGGSFDFIAGVVPRAPLWMQNAGLEWLYRLYLQPSRIGRMMRLPRFVLAVMRRGSE